MKKIPLLSIISFIFSLLVIIRHSPVQAYSLIMGGIQFPKTVQPPMVRIYCAGHIIKCEADADAKKLIYSIMRYNNQDEYYFLITQSIDFAATPAKNGLNTIGHITLAEEKKYKLYALSLKNEYAPDKEEKIIQKWRIQQKRLDKTRIVPDNTVIICMDPDWVEEVKAESTYELPTIHIQKNVLEIAGSTDKFYETCTRMLLSSLHSDTMHDTMKLITKQDKQRTLIAPAA